MGKTEVHIGELIRNVAKKQNVSAAEIADFIGCSSKNVYKLFKKADINTYTLLKISTFLQYDFFAEFSKSIQFGEFAKLDTGIL